MKAWKTLMMAPVALIAALALGCDGTEGPMGDQGDQGVAGESGAAGENGTPGEAGAKGDPGDPGAKGDPGDPGATGATGNAGAPGAAGAKGDPGAAGAKGDPSDPGAAGAKGDPGAAGLDGLACWDLDGNGACDLASEDTDADGACTVLDCQGAGGFQAPQYIGSEACAECHQSVYDSFIKTGHPYKLTKVEGGVAPARPFDSVTGGVPNPPLGLSWNDVSYVIGGFAWKARYVGADGYIVTGQEGELVQWNFPNDIVGKAGGWVAYSAGQKKPYDCGSCHTTGWIPCPVGDTTCEHQDGLEGMAGSFNVGGVHCEECHGPGSQHAAFPYLVEAKVVRDSEACGQCHIRGDVSTVDAKGGFVEHHEQYEELYTTKKFAMKCVDCHDPHKSVKFLDPTVNPTGGIKRKCTDCHLNYDKNQKSVVMQSFAKCIDCHMPRLGKSAWGDAAKFTGDVRSHMFAINTIADAPQFTEDGKLAEPYLNLDWACNSCHGVTASVKTQAELEASATGYHDF